MNKLTEFTRSVQLNHLASIVADNRNIDIVQAKKIISEMSFQEYHKLVEASADIIPPSGKPLGQQSAPQPGLPAQPGGPIQQQPGQVRQPGNQQPGMPQVPGHIQPTTQGQQPADILALGAAQQLAQQGKGPGQVQPTQEEMDLMRLKELAGISENCSAGATGAGAIAIAPAAMGGVKRRQQTDEHSDEYTPKGPPKTIVGDTKPGQASGELSANLAVRGKKTASRINNGFKR